MDAGWTNGLMDGERHGKIMLLSHILTMRGSNIASLGRIPSSGLGGDSLTDGLMEGGIYNIHIVFCKLDICVHSHKCPSPLFFAHKATTVFQMLNLTCYVF